MATPRKANPQKAGRKSNYRPEFVDLAYGYALLGLTEAEMMRLFKTTEAAFHRWKKKHPEFRKAIEDGKEPADISVIRSLRERATGYTVTKQVPIKVKKVLYNEQGKRKSDVEEVVVTTVTEEIPPDTQAMRYWLNNRRRKKPEPPAEGTPPLPADHSWADRHEIDHSTLGEKIPAPQVYLPTDIADPIIQETTGIDPLTNS